MKGRQGIKTLVGKTEQPETGMRGTRGMFRSLLGCVMGAQASVSWRSDGLAVSSAEGAFLILSARTRNESTLRSWEEANVCGIAREMEDKVLHCM
jgi:hypothetical protein